MTKIKNAAPIIFLSILFGFIFFYRIDYNTLASWDEAWYGSIAREIVRSGDFMKMIWNGKPYYDHPPMGFWLMAISYKLFGISEFSTRLPSAILGLFGVLLLYQTAVGLFNKKSLGLGAALVLGTCVWYVIRVRSGNLDSIFVFFYILTIFLSLKSSENFKWFPFAMLAFGGLMLTKTLVGLSAGILILYLNWRDLLKIRANAVYIVVGVVWFVALVYPWYYIQTKTYSEFSQHHFFNIGTRNKSFFSYFQPMLEQPLFYLHMGVRKWYYIWLASLGFLLFSLRFLKKRIFFLFLWNLIILYPFLTSKETELWHLIPVYLPLSFIVSLGMYEAGMLGLAVVRRIKVLKKAIPSFFFRQIIIDGLYLTAFLYIAFVQIRIFYKEVFPTNRWIPDDVAISKAASQYGKPIYLDDDYIPIAVFYSGRNVQPLAYLPDDKKTLAKFIQSDEKNFVVITRNWVVDDLKSKNISYRLLGKNNSFSILTKP